MSESNWMIYAMGGPYVIKEVHFQQNHKLHVKVLMHVHGITSLSECCVNLNGNFLLMYVHWVLPAVTHHI